MISRALVNLSRDAIRAAISVEIVVTLIIAYRVRLVHMRASWLSPEVRHSSKLQAKDL